MAERLAVEAENKSFVDLLFLGHRLEDISSDVQERKSGTDFLLFPRNHDDSKSLVGIRCENKFEQMATGRQLFEIASLDRPTLVPGWMFTSRAAWLLSWYPSAELVALPMDDARKLVLANPARNRTTTARNPAYLTWSALEDINYVVQNAPNARVIDLAYELGREATEPKMLRGASLKKRCTSEELVALMRTLPAESTPVATTSEHLKQLLRTMAPKNFKSGEHADMLERLSWLK